MAHHTSLYRRLLSARLQDLEVGNRHQTYSTDFARHLDAVIPHDFVLAFPHKAYIGRPEEYFQWVDQCPDFPYRQGLSLHKLFDDYSRELANVVDIDQIHGCGRLPPGIQLTLSGNSIWPIQLSKSTDEGEIYTIEIGSRKQTSVIDSPLETSLYMFLTASRDPLTSAEIDEQHETARRRFWPGQKLYDVQRVVDQSHLAGAYASELLGMPTHPDLYEFGYAFPVWLDKMMKQFIYRVHVNRMAVYKLRDEQKEVAAHYKSLGLAPRPISPTDVDENFADETQESPNRQRSRRLQGLPAQTSMEFDVRGG